MDKNQHVPSPAQAEEFWTEGQDAIQSATGTDLEPGTSTTESADAEYTEKRCSLCGAKRLSSGVCSLVPGRDGTGGCPDPMYDYRREKESVGIDLPGVGVIRSAEVSSDLAGREAVDGIGERSPDPVDVAFEALLKSGLKEIFITPAGVEALSDIAAGVEPEPPAERRERLFSQLVFAAKALADAQIEPATESEPAFCVECVKDAYDRGAIAHEDTCRTGRVNDVIRQLIATLRVQPEEAKPTGCPGESPAFPSSLLCFACGVRGGEWSRGVEIHPDGLIPEANRRVAVDAANTGRYLFTHHCEGGAR